MYIAGVPAYTAYPTVFISIEKANPRKLGERPTVNARTMHQRKYPLTYN
ncbi:MAG: hypothetical protein LBK73_07655 [Treponema sp.]|nr:hypothetical protein [Treponema sp.]